MSQVFDLLIVGGGVTGSALLYPDIEVYRYPARRNAGEICRTRTGQFAAQQQQPDPALWRHRKPATAWKALKVQRAARMVGKLRHGAADTIIDFQILEDGVFGVGAKECTQLRERFRDVVGALSPAGSCSSREGHPYRSSPAVALLEWARCVLTRSRPGLEDEYTAVNLRRSRARSVRQAQRIQGKGCRGGLQPACCISTGRAVVPRRTGDQLPGARDRRMRRRHSLKLAHDLGYGHHFSVLPVAGSFYFTPQVLRGKVYTVQNDKRAVCRDPR